MSLGRCLNSTGDLGSKGIICSSKEQKSFVFSQKESGAPVW
jgi:hypothetical protein